MKKFELLAATTLAMTFAPAAFAQTAPADAAATAPADTTTTNTQPAAVDDIQAGEVVVTAQRRSETVQSVPIAITALGARQLEEAGVTDVKDIEQIAPSVQTSTGQSSATGSTIYIRGITTAGDNPGFEPAVGVFIDGVFRARAGVAVSELPELERIEVLRGPQGTLFGRNTSAGALSVFTAKPNQQRMAGYVEGSYGNYDAWSLKGAITGPVSDQIALRLDGGYRQRDGYIKDANSDRRINDIDRWNVRAQALLDTGDLTFRLIGDYYKTDEQCCGSISVVRGALAPIIQGIAAAQGLVGLYTGPSSDRTEAISPNRNFAEKVTDYGVSGELNWDLGGVKLASITAWRNWKALRDQDVDFSGIDRAYRDGYRSQLRDFTQELRLQGSAFNGLLDWLVGGFFLNENNKLRDTVRIGNDGNRYVDSVFNALAGPSFGGSIQFFGTRGAAPTPGAVLLNPAVPNSLAALTSVYGATLAPLVGCFRTAVGTAPAGVVPAATCNALGYSSTPVPGLAALATTPLPAATAGQGNNNDDFRVKTNAFALFTHNIIHVTDQLSVTLGVRWNHETKKFDASLNNNLGSCAFFNQVRAGNAAATTYANLLRQLGLFNNLFLLSCNPAINSEFNGVYNDKRTENEFTGTAKLSYKVSPRLMIYGSYDHGYKSGGYNLDQATFDSVLLGGNGPQATDLRFGRETVNAYELGVKSSPSRQFSLNVAAFYQKYKGLQSLVFSGNNFVVQNVPKSTSRGVEVEANLRPSSNLNFQIGYSYIEAFYDKSNNFAGTPLAGQEGEQFNNQPKHTITIGGSWTPQISGDWHALVAANMRYNSEVNIPSGSPDINGRTALFNEGYPLIGARLGIESSDRSKRVNLFVENLTNKYYHITGFAVPEQTGNYNAYPGYPRFYGIEARFGF